MIDELVAWLRVQLDDDERVAMDARFGPLDQPWRQKSYDDVVQLGHYNATEMRDHPIAHCGPMGWDRARHIARHGPKRVVAEVEAKRRILDLHGPGVSRPDECGLCNETLPCETVRLLAGPLADRPGFREEWRPSGT